MAAKMPALDISGLELSDSDKLLVGEIVKKDMTLYATKPKKASADGKFLWRYAAFFVSPKPAHQCMPVTAVFDLMDKYEDGDKRREVEQRLLKLADTITRTVPIHEQHGTIRWGRALGML